MVLENPQYKKTVLFIGNQRYKSIQKRSVSTITSYVQKRLHTSQLSQWEETLRLIKDLNKLGNLVAVFLELSPDLLFLVTLDEYSTIWNEIFEEIRKTKCLILIDERLRKPSENFNDIRHHLLIDRYHEEIFRRYFHDPREEMYYDNLKILLQEKYPSAIKLLEEIYDSGVEIVEFNRRDGSMEKIINILDTIDPEMFFRLYVPKNHYKEDFIADFLNLLEDYLRKIAKKPFFIDQYKYAHGTMFVFKSSPKMSQEELHTSIEEFNTFLYLTQNDIEGAKSLLLNVNMNLVDAEKIINKYIRDFKRMKHDLRQQFEDRSIALKHRLENEIFESVESNTSMSGISAYQSTSTSPADIFTNININIYNQPVFDNSVVQKIAEEVVNGDIQYSEEDRKILELIQKYEKDELEASSLISELNILKDKSIPKDIKQTAGKKIGSFLSKLSPIVTIIEEKAIELLFDYLKKVSPL